MKIYKFRVLRVICAVMLTFSAFAADSAGNGMKLGFGFDRDFGVALALGNINGFVGNKGAAVDFIFSKKTLEMDAPAHWYVGVGGYGDWDGDLAARLPVGAELKFTNNMDAFAQIIPRLRINHGTSFGLDFAIGARYQF